MGMNSSKDNNLPKVAAYYKKKKICFLYDTGASISMIDSVVFDAFNFEKRNIKKIKQIMHSSIGVREFDCFQCRVELTIDHRTIEHDFLVFDQTGEAGIVGMDFIHKFGLQYNVIERSFEWKKIQASPTNPFH